MWPRKYLLISILSLAVPTVAGAGAPRVVAVSLTFDDAPIASIPTHPGQLQVYRAVEPELRKKGIAILATVDRKELIGGRSMRGLDIAELRIDLRAPDFSFNIVLLPPQWVKTPGGNVKLVDPASGEVMWDEPIKIPIKTAEGSPRWEATFARLPDVVRQLPHVGSAVRSAEIARLLQLNDVETDGARFIEHVRRLIEIEPLRRGDVLIDVAIDARMKTDPELRLELLRRAVVSGGVGVAPALGEALAEQLLAAVRDEDLTDLLVEGLSVLGAGAGDALAPYLDRFPLTQLLELRRRFTFDGAQDRLDRRLALLAHTAVAHADNFDDAEQLVASLPLAALTHRDKVALRDALYAHIEVGEAAGQYSRLLRYFPESEIPPPAEDHIDREFIAGAANLRTADEGARLAWFRQYLRASPRASAAPRLIRVLQLGRRLETELVERLRGAPDATAEREALVTVYGPHPDSEGHAAFGRALVGLLGDRPDADAIRALANRHPDLEAITSLTRDAGLVRDRNHHVLGVAPGDDLATVIRVLGEPTESKRGLARRDLSPAAFVASDHTVPKSKDGAFRALEYEGLGRILLAEGRVFRIVVMSSRGLFHHGIRTGDTRDQVVGALGPPNKSRSLMFGRQILTWNELDGTASLTAVLDGDRVTMFYEQSPQLLEQAMATLR